MTSPSDLRQPLEAAVAALQSQREILGDALVDAALAPLLERLAALSAQPELAPPFAPPTPAEPVRRLRQVSVLFLDIVGSTQLIQTLDPEEVQATVDGALAAFTAIVKQHGGEVLRYAGDNLKVVFGAHDTAGTREDDAERAVHCGLALLAEAARRGDEVKRLHGHAGFNARVGIHTGGVVRGGGVENDNSLSGLPVNIAARLEQAAPAGTLRISHDTWALVRGAFDAEPQPPLQVKGVDAPLKSYLVLAARDRSVASVERGLQGLSTPMVGRDTELLRLLQAATQARQTRQLQALTLLGDAGLGKSRLLREFKAALLTNPAGEPSGSQLLTVRAQPDSQLRPWGLLRSVLAAQCFVADTDSAEVARRKVVDGLSPWFEERGERQAQLIGQLSGLDFTESPNVKGLDPRTLRDQALAAFRSYLHALATRGDALLVLLVEDLHWCDDSSLDLLQHLLAHAAELPLLLVMTARPALLTRRPDWGTSDTLVTLHPLAAAQGDELARALLQRMTDVPRRLMALITGQAEGNPYYLEELVRRLIDDGVINTDGATWTVQADGLDTLRLPTTLVGLLQARLDALPVAERQAARQASVIGHVFWDDALQALDASAAQALPALQRTAYVRERERSDFEGTPERQFDHHLLHQVTYDTLLKAERKLGHGAAARWLAERTQGRGAEFLAMTGEHAERAGETALAVDCFEQAGEQAQKRFANAAAVQWLRRAITLLGDSDPGRSWELLYSLECIALLTGDGSGSDAAHEEMAQLLERHPDDARQAQWCVLKAMLAERRGDGAAAEPLLSKAVELAARCSAAKWAAAGHGNLAWLRYARQDYVAARESLDVAMHWARQVQPEDKRLILESRLLVVSACIAQGLCRYDEARAAYRSSLACGETLGLPAMQLGALQGLTRNDADLGLWESSAVWATRLHELALTVGAVPLVAAARWHQAYAAESMGRYAAATPLYEEAVDLSRAAGNRRKEALALQRLGTSHLALGSAAEARQFVALSQALHQTLDDWLEACITAGHAARCELALGQDEAALSTVNGLLVLLSTEGRPAHETIEPRWACQQVLQALGDARAAAMLEQLFADVQASAAEMTDAADRPRLIQALPDYRAIVAAYGVAYGATSSPLRPPLEPLEPPSQLAD